MKPEEAINILDQLAAQANTTRQGHIVLQQALETIRQLVQQNQPTIMRSEPKDN